MPATFAEKLASDSDSEVFLVRGFDFTGRNCWYFVKVRKSKAAQFSAMIAKGSITDLAEHGTVLISGYGDTPPPSAYEAAKQ